MTRRQLRERIFQVLFQEKFYTHEELPEQRKLFFETEEILDEEDRNAIEDKAQKVTEHLEEIDAMLNEYAKGWKTSRMNKIDLTIMRLAAYEIHFDEDIPKGVAVNEAVELAKKYGTDASPAFVNGVLAKID